VSDSLLAKIVVSVILLFGFAVWLISEPNKPSAFNGSLPTDISAASRK
jgi:hypothetical protein